MSESEFDIIENYFNRLNDNVEQPDWLVKGIGDDAAILNPADEMQLLIAMDTLNSGVHFPQHTPANDIGYKSLAVNLSDIAAMGGEPSWFTLSLSLPEVDATWLKEFCGGMAELMKRYHLRLIGGDTTQGPLSVTVQITGQVCSGTALTRDNARAEDDIYITGYPGDAAAGLILIRQGRIQNENAKYLITRLNRPTPRVELGQSLHDCGVHACIDVSDGLVADLGHILDNSRVASGQTLGAELYKQKLPISKPLSAAFTNRQQQIDFVLFGGDDYELCFTAAPEQRDKINLLAEQFNIPVTRIGKVTAEQGLYLVDDTHRQELELTGFDHFKKYD